MGIKMIKSSAVILSLISQILSKIPNEYRVYFRPDHTLQKHLKHVGRGIDIGHIHEEGYYGYIPDTNTKLHAAIRSDPGVDHVSQNGMGYIDFEIAGLEYADSLEVSNMRVWCAGGCVLTFVALLSHFLSFPTVS